MITKATQIILPLFLLAAQLSSAQNIGIGIATPVQKLEVNGAIKIASNDAVPSVKGTMRWNENKNDFEGYNGLNWISLTGGKTGIGDQATYVHENNGIDPMLGTSTLYNFSDFGRKMVKSGMYYITSASRYSSVYSEDMHTHAQTGTVLRWSRQAGSSNYTSNRFTSPNASAEGRYGFDIAADEQRLVVTEPGANIGNNEGQGRAYIYTNGNFASPVTITAADGQANEGFGYAAAIKENYAAIGSPMRLTGTVRTGRVYIFRHNASTNTWSSSQIFGGGNNLDMFGAGLAITNEWLAIGSPKAAYGANADHGKVQMFRLNTVTGNWSTHSTIIPTDGYHNGFGGAITIKSDTMMITENSEMGGVKPRYYMYILRNNVWEQVKEFIIPDAVIYPGMSQADFLGNRVVIGEANARIGASANNGRAHVFEWKNNDWQHTSILLARIPQRGQYFGRSVLLDHNVIFCGGSATHGFFDYSGMIFSFDIP